MKKFNILLSVCTVFLSACASTPDTDNNAQQPSDIPYTIPEGEGNGEEQWFGYGAISGVGDTAANGVAQSRVYEDGSYVHMLNVNIHTAPDGFFYEGWLVKGSDVISTGKLSNALGDTRYALQFESDDDLRQYTKVVITLEKDDGNAAPDMHVAEGNLHVMEPRRS